MGFAVLLYATYSQWSLVSAPQTAYIEPPSQQQTPDTTKQSKDEVLGLSDTLPSIAGMSISQETVTATVRTEKLENNVIQLYINPSRGADIVGANLTKYHPSKKQQEIPVELLSLESASYHYFQTGILSLDGENEANHTQAFTRLSGPTKRDGKTSVKYIWQQGDIEVIKTYSLSENSYAVSLEQEVTNYSSRGYSFVPYVQLVKRNAEVERSMFDVETYSFDGGIIYDGDSYEKLYPDDLKKNQYSQTHNAGWAANIKHHFLVAFLPPLGEAYKYEATHSESDRLNKISAISLETRNVSSGQSETAETTLFIGPKLQKQLRTTRDGLERSVDYGKLSFLASPLFWLLENIFEYVANWGLSIILVTLLIKIIFFRLTESSGKSMARMRELQPRLKAIQDRYENDKQAQSKATMDLYQKENVNPMAGCLPMLIQIPFFIAFYWVLLESVEIRQAPFFLWLNDLSSRDPYFVLPILMGLGMWFQQKLNPAPPDPTQAKVMAILPIMFTGLFAWFPSGLVLYWLTNSLLSIAQQWRINKRIETAKPGTK
tara:strand:- start:1284 stop:2921 length:1638 start_codon:yes stop_codon:yes gene_type:complete